jgi:hypothetical protein
MTKESRLVWPELSTIRLTIACAEFRGGTMRVAIASVGFAALVFQNAGAAATTGTAGDAAISCALPTRSFTKLTEQVRSTIRRKPCKSVQSLRLSDTGSCENAQARIGHYPTGQPAPADNRPVTAEQAETLRRLAKDAYELDAFKPNLTRAEADRRIAALTAKLKLLDEPPHTL